MKDEDLNQLLDSIKNDIGEEVHATIADKIGQIITMNAKVQEQLSEQEKEITRLKDTNDKLVSANGALLMQVPTIKKEEPKVEDDKPTYYDYHSAFDENGNII